MLNFRTTSIQHVHYPRAQPSRLGLDTYKPRCLFRRQVVPIYTVAYLQHDVIEWSRVFGQAIGTYVLIFASVNYLFYKSIRERAERDE